MANFISEDQIELAIVKVLKEQLGYETLNCFTADGEDLNDVGTDKGQTSKQYLAGTLETRTHPNPR